MRINEMFDIEFPVFQGGMASIATGEFAAAVSNAGAMGIIGSGSMDGPTLREHIRRCKELTDRPFGVNLMMMNPHVDELAEIIAEEKVALVTTGAGSPGKYVARWQEAGTKIFPVVSSLALVKRLERLGVDGFIAEGCESGGHVGELTTMVLVPQVVDQANVPVIAAGGIASGRQMAAAFTLGACGVQIGTSLLVSEECPIHDNYKAKILKAKSNDTMVTGRINGAPTRVLKNPMARNYLSLERAGAEKMELEKVTMGALRKAVVDGDERNGSFMCGQVSGMLTEIRPLRTIIEEMYSECLKIEGGRG